MKKYKVTITVEKIFDVEVEAVSAGLAQLEVLNRHYKGDTSNFKEREEENAPYFCASEIKN